MLFVGLPDVDVSVADDDLQIIFVLALEAVGCGQDVAEKNGLVEVNGEKEKSFGLL